jgi:para-nitrobenzyl esterase
MHLLTPILLCLFLFACSKSPAPSPPPEADQATLRTTALGDVVGFVTPDGAHAWRKLPFAAAPVGDLRWRAPRPAVRWEGVREGLAFAERCLQMSNRLNAGEGIEPGLALGSEDCLYLDVYAPPDAEGGDLPVMVWIHGGANVWGRGSSYEGSRLAVNEDVIVVIVQYRVGPFGFFSHPFLRETAETREDAAANFATLDLIASLKWVRGNIAAFGGDAENVTIFGESAGGHNVATLLASPLAEGLFHRAILQSGSFDSVPRDDAEQEGERNNASDVIVARLGATDGASLRAASPQAIIDAYKEGAFDFMDMPTVIQDGVTLPATPLRDALASTENFNAVPVMTGTNRDEMKFFLFGDQRFVKQKFFMFPAPRDREFWDRINHYMARVWRIRAVDGPAAAMKAAGHDAVYAYRFDWDDSGRFLFSDFGELVGAGHAVEIPFVFNRFEFFGPRYDKIFFEKKTETSRQELSRAMGAYWASFARDGVPSAANAPSWPAWPAQGATLIRFDSASDGGIGLIDEGDSVDRLIQDLANDPKLDAVERCAIVAEITPWTPELGEKLSVEIDCEAET